MTTRQTQTNLATAEPTTDDPLDRWTVAEVFGVLSPDLMRRIADPDGALRPLTRRADFVAIRDGYGWNPHGRYPLEVWLIVCRPDFK